MDVADYTAMNKTQLKALLKQIHPRFCEPQIKLPMAIFPPTVEILKGLYFENAGSDASCFYVWVFFMPLCVPSNQVVFNLGRRIGGKNQRWNLKDPMLHEKLSLAIQAEAIPFLSQAQTPHLASKFALSLASSSKSPYSVQASAYLLARSGDVAAAINSLETLLSSLKKDVPWQLEMAIRAEKLKSLLIENTDHAIWQLKE